MITSGGTTSAPPAPMTTTGTAATTTTTPRRGRVKLVMLGETATGKTSLATRFAKKTFHEFQESTIGAAYMTGSIPSGACTFEIWDTAGQERYHSLAPMYYRGAKAAAVVYDVTSRASFDRAKDWVTELRKDGPATIVIALAGNKADLSSKREVMEDEAKAYATSAGISFMETSAKTGFGVDAFFEMIAERLPAPGDGTFFGGAASSTQESTGTSAETSVSLAGAQDGDQQGKTCCQ